MPLTALATIGLALAADAAGTSRMPKTGNDHGVGAWLVIVSNADHAAHQRERLFCTKEGVLELEKRLNATEENPQGRARELSTWLDQCEPGWIDDGFWNMIWILAIRRDAMAVHQPLQFHCRDVAMEPHPFRFRNAKEMKARLALAGNPKQGNGNGVTGWFYRHNGTTQGKCTINGAMRTINWYEPPGPQSIYHASYPSHPALQRRFRNWLLLCRPGDAIHNDFGYDWIYAVAEDSENTGGHSPEWTCDDFDDIAP